jgi:hypothetical protein
MGGGDRLDVEGTAIGKYLAVRRLDNGNFNVDHIPTGFRAGTYYDRGTATIVATTLATKIPAKYLSSKEGTQVEQGVRSVPYLQDWLGNVTSYPEFEVYAKQRAKRGGKELEPPPPPKRDVGKVQLVLINPKDHTLVSAVFNSGSVYLYRPEDVGGSEVGNAYLDGSEQYEIPDEEIDDAEDGNPGEYRRSHSPGGVRVKGGAYGFLLYGALSYLAYNKGSKYVRGICSPEGGGSSGRSGFAATFWTAAVELGTAKEAEVESDSTEERDTEYEIPEECDYTGDDECQEVTSTRAGRIYYTAGSREDLTIQYMPAAVFKAQEVVLMDYTDHDPPGDVEIQTPALLGLNLKHCTPLIASHVVSKLQKRGVTREEMKPLLDTLPKKVLDEIQDTIKEGEEMAANRRRGRSRYVMNASERKAAWDKIYGDLKDMP